LFVVADRNRPDFKQSKRYASKLLLDKQYPCHFLEFLAHSISELLQSHRWSAGTYVS
jgi:hypothetical protein